MRASLIAPTCEDCGLLFGNALNQLLRGDDTHLVSGDLAYIFWTREPMGFEIGPLFSTATPDEVRAFLSSPWKGRAVAPDLETTPFYAAAFSAANARVVVRDWIETTLEEARRNLRRYFGLQRLVTGEGKDQYFALWQLARATTNSKSKHEKPAPQVGQALMHLALHGAPAPNWLMFQAVRRARAEQGVTTAQAALIKMVLLTQVTSEEGLHEVSDMNDLAALDRTHPESAYHCGRLLAELEAVQRAALGYDISATVVDRYYGTASSAPASVFGRLLRGAQPHLSKLHRDQGGLWNLLDERLREITGRIGDFPKTLSLREQGLFALGYWHQRAADSRDRLAASEARKAKAAANGTSAAGDGAL